MLKKKKFIISGIVLIAAFVYLLFLGFGSSVAYYDTVGELLEKGDSVYGENVRVKGTVGSIEEIESGRILFVVADDTKEIQMDYRGQPPDAFKDGAEVVVEGKLNSDGTIFTVSEILTKCPSKYEAK